MPTPLSVHQGPAGTGAQYPALIVTLPVNSAWTGCPPPASGGIAPEGERVKVRGRMGEGGGGEERGKEGQRERREGKEWEEG